MLVEKSKGYIWHPLTREKGARQNILRMMPPRSFSALKETDETIIGGEKFTRDHSTRRDVHASPGRCHKHNYGIWRNLV
jgi:hypothetical protein